MPDQCAGFSARARKTKAIRDIVQTAFEQHEQCLTGDPLGAVGLGEGAAKLIFQQAVNPFDLLLLAQLDAVLGELRSALPMLSRRIVASLDRALVRVTTLALEKELQIFAPAEPAHRICVSSQSSSS